ncbi:MAG TPA: hypothetical protein VH092_19640 [Urbifossiella sp.]|jgi:hypothetical protein|nr:hypothetical protein [Urbifossiella sp.]
MQSRRKGRLAAAAGLRHFWADLSDDQRRAVAAAERYADGEIRFSELRAAAVPVGPGAVGTLPGAVAQITHREYAGPLRHAATLFVPVVVGGPVYTNPPFPAARAYAEQGRPMMAILRCVFGNPFRPIAVGPSWRTSAVVALAVGIYAERAFDRLPVLADALEDAGCGDEEVLAHCRGAGPHVRGCWVVDLVLGKQ